MSLPIIFGCSGYNTLGTIRCFGEMKTPFILILVTNSRWEPVLSSKYVTNYKIVKDEQAGIDLLLSKKDKWTKSVIIPTSDKAESLLDKNFNILIDNYQFPNAGKQGAVNLLMEKDVQAKIAIETGILVPQTWAYSKGSILPADLIYPCIIKPQKSISGSKGILKACYTHEELVNAIEASKRTSEFLIQQYVNKEYEILLLGCKFSNGKTWTPAVFRKDRWYLKGNDGSYGEITTDIAKYINESTLNYITDFIDKSNYIGPFSIEFGMEDEKLYFYEINLRNDGTSHYFHKAGIYMPYIWYKSHFKECFEEPHISNVSYKFIDELGDFINLRTEKLPILSWIKSLKTAESFKYYNHKDLIPFFMMAPRRIVAGIYKMFTS